MTTAYNKGRKSNGQKTRGNDAQVIKRNEDLGALVATDERSLSSNKFRAFPLPKPMPPPVQQAQREDNVATSVTDQRKPVVETVNLDLIEDFPDSIDLTAFEPGHKYHGHTFTSLFQTLRPPKEDFIILTPDFNPARVRVKSTTRSIIALLYVEVGNVGHWAAASVVVNTRDRIV